MLTGRLVNVYERQAGSELAADVTGPVTVITIADSTDFNTDPDGGTIQIGSEIETYLVADEDAGTLTVAGTVSGTYLAGQRVSIYPQWSERWATLVETRGGSELQARINHGLWDKIAIGTRGSLGELVEAIEVGEDLVVSDIVGKVPEVDAGFIKPKTFKNQPSDGVPPATSPTPAVRAALAALMVTWSAITNVDPVTYEVHISTSSGFTPDATTKSVEIQGTGAVIRTTPDGGVLDYDTTYFVKIVAKDVDGSAPASAQGSSSPVQVTTPDIMSENVVAGHLLADDALFAKLQALLIITNTLKTADNGQRVEIDVGGVRWYDATGALGINFPTATGQPAILNADLVANTIDVLGNMTLRASGNSMDVGSAVTLQSSLADPAVAPSLVVSQEVLNLTGGNAEQTAGNGLFYTSTGGAGGATATFFVTQDLDSGVSVLEEYNASTGAFIRQLAVSSGFSFGSKRFYGAAQVLVGGNRKIITLTYREVNHPSSPKGWYLTKRDAVTLAQESEVNIDANIPNNSTASTSAYLGVIGGNPVVVTFKSSSQTAASVARLLTYNASTMALSSTQDTSGKNYTPEDFEQTRFVGLVDDGSNVWVNVKGDPVQGNISHRYNSSTFAYESNHDFQGYSGLAWDGTRFWARRGAGTTPSLRKYTLWDWTTESSKYWIGYTWYNSTAPGTFTVTIASPAVFTRVSHGLVVGDQVFFTTTGALPTGLTAGTTYYVIAAGLTADNFEVSTTPGGAAVNTSGTQSGTHTLNVIDETLVSPRTSLDLGPFRRHRITVTVPTLPSGVSKARLYVERNASAPATTALHLQAPTTYVDTDTSSTVQEVNFNSSGVAPPTVNSFGGGTPAELKSSPTTGGLESWSLRGDGSMKLVKGTTSELSSFTPNAGEGCISYDETLDIIKLWDGTAWREVQGPMGTWFSCPVITAPSSQAVGVANTLFYHQIIVPAKSTLTGIEYIVGGTSAGSVRSALYDSAGNRVANRTTNVAQGVAGAVQAVDFDSTATVQPGAYFASLIFSNATATFIGCVAAAPAGSAAQGAFSNPSTITVPTQLAGGIPRMVTH